jgi:hypothetical protein
MSYLIPITSLSADNLGGVLSIQVARKIDISAIPDPVDGVVTGAVTFFPEKGFVNWVTIGESAGNSSASRASREGSSRNNRLPFRVAKDRATLRTMFVLAEEDEFIVLFTDANGKKKNSTSKALRICLNMMVQWRVLPLAHCPRWFSLMVKRSLHSHPARCSISFQNSDTKPFIPPDDKAGS